VPVVRHFFGVQPMAGEGVLRLAPRMPTAWREASLENVRALDGAVSLHYARTERGYNYHATFTGDTPMEICIERGHSVRIGATVCPMDNAPFVLRVDARELTVDVTE